MKRTSNDETGGSSMTSTMPSRTTIEATAATRELVTDNDQLPFYPDDRDGHVNSAREFTRRTRRRPRNQPPSDALVEAMELRERTGMFTAVLTPADVAGVAASVAASGDKGERGVRA